MASEGFGSRWQSHASSVTESPKSVVSSQPTGRLRTSIRRTVNYLRQQQSPEGYWVGELEGDTILESEYVLLLVWLGRERSEAVRQAANYMRSQQRPVGGWSIYPGGPLEISASVKAYFALKIAGDDPEAEHMQRARKAILDAGGAEKVNSFTRFYLALLGIIGYDQCPAVPAQLMLLPKWMPFNIYEMSSWSRTILVPLTVIYAHRPVRQLPAEWQIDEIFLNSPSQLPVCMPPSETLDAMKQETWLDWYKVFRGLDRTYKVFEKLGIKPFRKRSVGKATQWVLDRFSMSDGLGAIFPPIIWSVVALKCEGYGEDSPEVAGQLRELERLFVYEGDELHLQPCKSPVWDTAIATIALREAGVSREDVTLRRSVDWLLSKEVKHAGDWTVNHPSQPPAGWYFEFNNEFYPDVDDTAMVVMALARCLPENEKDEWSSDFFFTPWSPHESDRDSAAVVSGRERDSVSALRELETSAPIVKAIWRGVRWVLSMQSRDGGWGAFDSDNDRELFTRVPFADHNAMIDPSTVDLTARVLEMFGRLGTGTEHPKLQQAASYVWSEQEADHAWYGRWGVNYLYGTWQCLVGMRAFGTPSNDPRLQKAADWLVATQNNDGGWGETPESYDDPTLRGQGESTPSQTAWALMGLIAADRTRTDVVTRGIEYLVTTQKSDGTWDEPQFTGTGFPRVFYLRYHLYCIYFPLMALGRYERAMEKAGH